MASYLKNLSVRRSQLFLQAGRRLLAFRRCHTQNLWEALLGRKLEPGSAKKLDDAFLEYKVRKSVPSWLPFLPNSSFWIPSTEETVKSLEGLAKRVKPATPDLASTSHDSYIQPIASSHIHTAPRSVLKQMDNLLSLEETGRLLEIRVANDDEFENSDDDFSEVDDFDEDGDDDDNDCDDENVYEDEDDLEDDDFTDDDEN